METIKLTDGYSVNIDPMYYALVHEYTNRKGKADSEILGYYATFGKALKAYREELVRNNLKMADDMESALEAVKAADERVYSYCEAKFVRR